MWKSPPHTRDSGAEDPTRFPPHRHRARSCSVISDTAGTKSRQFGLGSPLPTLRAPHGAVGSHCETSATHRCPAEPVKHAEIGGFCHRRLASRLLYQGMSGGFSGPACRSGVPLEQPPFQYCLPGCRESRKALPAPPCTDFAELLLLIADC